MKTRRRPTVFGRQAVGEPISWSWAEERLILARNYWVAVCLPQGRPHARPVWGVWVDTSFWYSTHSRAVGAVEANPHAVVHLESGDEVVIVEGGAGVVEPLAARQRFTAAYNTKYGWDLHVTEHGVGDDAGAAGEVLAVRPRRVYAWDATDLETAACWEFSGSGQ